MIDPLAGKQHNERLKVWAGVTSNLGVGLLGAEVAIYWADKGNDATIWYAVLGFMISFGSALFMSFMVDEG